MNIVCLAGGVGGAKLADGLARLLPVDQLTIIGNTGDDFEHWGLKICPDLDTVLYTLAGVASVERGWGLEGESWRTLTQVGALAGPDWFRIGDLDLATHLARTHYLRQDGLSLTAATRKLCAAQGVTARLLPMSDEANPTLIETTDGVLGFQDWFVLQQWQPNVQRVILPDTARATNAVISALQKADAVVIAPSNPFVSVDPILNAYPIRPIIEDLVPVVIAVTPIIGGDAVKGPLAKMLRDWGKTVSAETIAQHYGDLLTGFIYDQGDDPFTMDDVTIVGENTWMRTAQDRTRVAQAVINLIETQHRELA